MTRYHLAIVVLAVFVCRARAETLEIPDANIRSLHNVSVPVLEAGVLLEYRVKEGDLVGEGDVLATIDDAIVALEKEAAELEAEVARLRSENDVDKRFAKKSAEVAKAEVKRLRAANRRYAKSVSESEQAQLELQAERATLALEQADRDLEEANVTVSVRESQADVLAKRLEHTSVTSPITGVVVERFVDAGEWANVGTPLIRVISMDKVRVEAYANAGEVNDSLLGKTAEFEITAGESAGERVPCTVTFVSPEIHPVDQSVRIFAEIDNSNGLLKPGLPGVLRVEM